MFSRALKVSKSRSMLLRLWLTLNLVCVSHLLGANVTEDATKPGIYKPL